MGTTWLLIAATAVCVIAMLVAEWRRWDRLVWVAKPLASTGFVAVALAEGALESPYGLAILTALTLSWLGDMLLIPRDHRSAFLGGLGSFLLGHVAFVVAWIVRGLDPLASAIALLPSGLMAWRIHRWLSPHLPDRLRKPVIAYIVVITAMVGLAVGTAVLHPDPRLLFGAVAFFASDIAVARERLVKSAFANRAWGLPLYYGAQVLLALTV